MGTLWRPQPLATTASRATASLPERPVPSGAPKCWQANIRQHQRELFRIKPKKFVCFDSVVAGFLRRTQPSQEPRAKSQKPKQKQKTQIRKLTSENQKPNTQTLKPKNGIRFDNSDSGQLKKYVFFNKNKYKGKCAKNFSTNQET